MTTYDPDNWATTMWRSLKTYIETIVNGDVYEILHGFPPADELSRLLPMEKTLIHFDIADIREGPLGFGDNYVSYVRNETDQTIEYWEAHRHDVDFDIGIWASAQSGGVTSRLEARTLLTRLFTGKTAYTNCLSVTDGIHINRLVGGRNLIDEINDIPLWRMVDIALTVQVFSRYKVLPPVPYVGDIDDVTQAPALEIGGQPIT